MLKSVFIITPVFNDKDKVLRFVQSVKEQDYKDFKLIIIDDGSQDGTSDALRELHPEVIVLQGDGNLWWSGGTNLGVRYAIKNMADYVLTINHDVVLGPDYLSSLVSFAKEHPHSLVGSMVVSKTSRSRVWFFGGGYNQQTGSNQHTMGQVTDFVEPSKTTWLTGMGVLIPTSVFSEVGYYDEKNFPLYFGDADFSERARRSGYTLWVNPRSIVYGDVENNWVGKNVRRPKIGFIVDIFRLTNSPYQWKSRRLYYKLYWPGNYRVALFKFYVIESRGLYLAYLKGLVKRALKRSS